MCASLARSTVSPPAGSKAIDGLTLPEKIGLYESDITCRDDERSLCLLPEIAQVGSGLRQGNLWPGNFGMPFLFPLQGEIAIIAAAFEQGADFAQWHTALAGQAI